MPKKHVLLFSSGRTSSFLIKYFLTKGEYTEKIAVYRRTGKPLYYKWKNALGDEAIILMMNTGKEREESLEFARRCDTEWNLGIIYLEAVINPGKGNVTTHNIKKWRQLSRKGEPFEAMLKKYPLPNNKASNCTRELKLRPKDSFLRDIGWTDAITVVGIRADEAHRKSSNAVEERIIYPLCDEIKVDSRFIRTWWDQQPFDLKLNDYQGNCDLCFKKSLKKRLTIIKEDPYRALWWLVQEEMYSTEDIPRFDLRTNVSIEELIELSKRPFETAKDQHLLSKKQLELFNYETDCFCKVS